MTTTRESNGQTPPRRGRDQVQRGRSPRARARQHNALAYTLRLDGVRFRGRHGASRTERALPQDFVVAVRLELPTRELPSADSARAVFDYDEVARLVVEVGESTSFRLLEWLAAELIDRIFQKTPATSAHVEVTKLRPPTTPSVDAATVGLSASRA